MHDVVIARLQQLAGDDLVAVVDHDLAGAVTGVVRVPSSIGRLRVERAAVVIGELVRRRRFETLEAVGACEGRKRLVELLSSVPRPVDVSGGDAEIVGALITQLESSPRWETAVVSWLAEDLGPVRTATLLNHIHHGTGLGGTQDRRALAALAAYVGPDAVDADTVENQTLIYCFALRLRTRTNRRDLRTRPDRLADALLDPSVSDELAYTVEQSLWTSLRSVDQGTRWFAADVAAAVRARSVGSIRERLPARRVDRLDCLLAVAGLLGDGELVALGARLDGSWASWVLAGLEPTRRHLLLQSLPEHVTLAGVEDILSSAPSMGATAVVAASRRARPRELGGWLAADATGAAVDSKLLVLVVDDIVTGRDAAAVAEILTVVDGEASPVHRPDIERLALHAPGGSRMLDAPGVIGSYLREHVVAEFGADLEPWRLFGRLQPGWTGSIAALCRTCRTLHRRPTPA